MRLATYNILHGMPVLGGASSGAVPNALPAAVAELAADLLGMQEVDVNQPRSGRVHQVQQAAAAMGAEHWRFIPTVVGTPGPGASFRPVEERDIQRSIAGDIPEPLYGVGMVSRLPVVRWQHLIMTPPRITLPLLVPSSPRPRILRVPDEPRAALAAVIDLGGQVMTVVTAHLSFVPGVNASQLKQLRRWLEDLPRPLVLLGDFNLPGKIPSRLTGWQPALLEPTYPVFRPRIQFDHVLLDGARMHATEVHSLHVSDHCAVTADLDQD